MRRNSFAIDITNRQRALRIDRALLRRAVRTVLAGESFDEASVSLAILDDAAIRRLNRQYLVHDYPTDVLSFVWDRGEGRLEGEVIVSADTARSSAPRFGWPAEDELLLYVVHGLLHLAGYDDRSRAERARMRRREQKYLAALGREPRYRPVRPGAGRDRTKLAGGPWGRKRIP
jgi:probable rRNA maturation factor